MKKFIALIVLLQLGIIAGANENSSKDCVSYYHNLHINYGDECITQIPQIPLD